jgi:hypothetical protein
MTYCWKARAGWRQNRGREHVATLLGHPASPDRRHLVAERVTLRGVRHVGENRGVEDDERRVAGRLRGESEQISSEIAPHDAWRFGTLGS